MTLPQLQIRRPRSFLRAEVLVAICLVILALWTMSSYKNNNWYWQRGDSAVLYQTVSSIARTGKPASEVFATTTAFVFDSKLATLPALQFPDHDLSPPPSLNDNPLGGHAYLILYPLALFAKAIPARPLLLDLTVFCFIGLVALAYLESRRRGVPIIAALLLCALVISHPSWYSGLLYGQVYPDRFFILLGLGLMFAATRPIAKRPVVIALAGLCALVNERGAIIAGIFLLAYACLYWKTPKSERLFRASVGLGLVLYGLFLLKFVLVNPIYANQAPSFAAILSLFRNPTFVQQTLMMFIVSLPLLVIAAFEWRAAIIALLLMIPNVVTNIGGAEKVGWSTHYSSFYFPALVWAAVLGCAVLYRVARSTPWMRIVAPVLLALLTLSSNMLDPNSFAHPATGIANLSTGVFGRVRNYVPSFLGAPGAAIYADGLAIEDAVPDDARVVSTVEQGMPLLYAKPAKLLFFPMGLDTADYAVMSTFQTPGKPRVFFGAVTFLGPDAQKQLNDEVIARMKRDGYDFAHALISPRLGLAVVKRSPR